MYDLAEIGPPSAPVAYPEPDRQGWLDNIEAPLPKVGKVEDWLTDRIHNDAQIRASILEYVNNNVSHEWDRKRKIRYASCGQTVLMANVETGEIREEKHFCNNATYCPNCQRIQAKKKRLSVSKDIQSVEDLNHERVRRILPTVSTVQEIIAEVRKGVTVVPAYGQVGQTKDHYRSLLQSAILHLKTISEDIKLKDIRVALNGAREALRASGFQAILISQFLDEAKELLQDQINYRWQHATLTVRNKGNKSRSMDVLKKCWPRIRRAMFSGVDVAGFESIEIEGSSHIHVIFFGPWVNQRKLKNKWRELTSSEGLESYMCKVRDCYDKDGKIDEKALNEGIKYAIKHNGKSPEQIFEAANALKGRKRFQRWGTLRGLGKRKKRKAPIIGKYTAEDGGVDIVRDTRPVRNGQIYEYLS